MGAEYHTIDQQVQVIIDVLWNLRKGDKFYFQEYGHDMIKSFAKRKQTEVNNLAVGDVIICSECGEPFEQKEIENKKMEDFAPQMYSVLKELQESASYWSEYDVPLGIVDRINDVLKQVEDNKTTDTIKTTFDLRTCFTNMQNEEGFVSLSKTQWEEILKQIEK